VVNAHFWIACLVTACTTGLLIAILRPLAAPLGLIDHPNDRKQHIGTVPLIGGLSIFGGIVVGTLFFGGMGPFRTVVIETAAVMAVIGALDDRHDLSVRVRLAAQSLCVLTVCVATGVHITTLGHVMDYPLDLGLLGVPVTVVAVIGLLNAFNLMDGIDGLAGSQALVSVATLLAFHGHKDLRGTIILVAFLASAAVPYLVVNLGLTRRKIFLGDAGSMVIGYLLAWALIRLAEAKDSPVGPSDVLWCVALPVLDTLAVMGRRVMEGRSPFKADRGHIHHLLMGRGLTARQTLVTLLGVSVLFSAFGYIMRGFSSGTSILSFVVLAAAYATAVVREYHRQTFSLGTTFVPVVRRAPAHGPKARVADAEHVLQD